MADAVLGIVALALVAFHVVEARRWGAERSRLVNAALARTPEEFVTMERALTPRRRPERKLTEDEREALRLETIGL